MTSPRVLFLFHRARRLLLLATLLLNGCMPSATFRPLVPFPSETHSELGFGGDFTQRREETTFFGRTGPNFHFWYGESPFEHLQAGVRLSAGRTTLVVGGGWVRLHFAPVEFLKLGLDAEAGVAYAELGVPIALRLHDRLWLYTRPSILAVTKLLGLPAGISVRVSDNVSIVVESGAAVYARSFNLLDLHAGAAVAIHY